MSDEVDLEDALRRQEPDGWPDDAERVRNVGEWYVWQRRRGHRTSTDDTLVAWMAVRAFLGRSPELYADLGCGIGSVLFAVAHALRPARSIGVEAQAQSALLARRTCRELPADAPRVEIEHGDLRTWRAPHPLALVTGSPPYFPIGTGVLSPDAQRRACRFELRGGVEAYCEAAARVLAPDGRFYVVFQTVWHDRVAAAARSAGLAMVERVDLTTREGEAAPFLTGYGLVPEAGRGPENRAPEDCASEDCAVEHVTVRDATGAVTPAWNAVRRLLGYERDAGGAA